MATPTNLPSSFTSGDVLTAANMNNLRGAFRILQVVQASYATQVSTTSGTYADTGLTASITPQATSSLIIAIYSHNIFTNAASTGGGIRLLRGSTTLKTDIDLCFGAGSGMLAQHSFIYLDSPASTSALTYKTQIARTTGAGTVFTQTNNASNTSNLLLFEVSA